MVHHHIKAAMKEPYYSEADGKRGHVWERVEGGEPRHCAEYHCSAWAELVARKLNAARSGEAAPHPVRWSESMPEGVTDQDATRDCP